MYFLYIDFHNGFEYFSIKYLQIDYSFIAIIQYFSLIATSMASSVFTLEGSVAEPFDFGAAPFPALAPWSSL